MKFGLFGSAQAQRGGPDLDSGQGFRDYIEYNVEAEALGYNCTFVVEHHFTGFGQVSASLNSADLGRGAHQDAAARHRRDGAALAQSRCCSPSRRPPSICCPAAGSNSASARATATTSSRASASRWRRPTSASRKASRSSSSPGPPNERFSHHGKYWNFENIIVEPPTRQKPHPPIWMAAGNPDSIRKVARRGCQAAARPACLDAARDRAFQHLQGRGRGLRPAVRSDGCRA